MLTFTFTGVDGTMTECETLTSGMVGKQVLLVFDESWNQLQKTVVFRAGDLNRVVTDAGSTVTIPEAVLARPFGRLFVGVYGTDAAGTVVIPTIMAEGPMIRYGADPMKDETAKELPVWQDLQNQIGDLGALKTNHTKNLTGAINELHTEVSRLSQNAVPFTARAAQLLVDILLQADYGSDQDRNISELATELGITPPQQEADPICHWDFRSGSLQDLVAGVDAAASADVTLDTAGAHITAKNSYIMLPAGPDGATLSGKVLEVKFGRMTLNEGTATHRLVLCCAGTQPATVGLQWNSNGCWAGSSSAVTALTDLQMFSGKTLLVRGDAGSNRVDWYLEDTLLCSTTPSFVPTHISLGSSMNGAFPMVVEQVKVYSGL